MKNIIKIISGNRVPGDNTYEVNAKVKILESFVENNGIVGICGYNPREMFLRRERVGATVILIALRFV